MSYAELFMQILSWSESIWASSLQIRCIYDIFQKTKNWEWGLVFIINFIKSI